MPGSAAPSSQVQAVLPWIDLVWILVFASVGIGFHGGSFSAEALARNVVPLSAGWYLVAALTGLYQKTGWPPALINFVLGIPLGLVLRQALLGRGLDNGFWIFAGVSLAATLLLMLAARALAKLGGIR